MIKSMRILFADCRLINSSFLVNFGRFLAKKGQKRPKSKIGLCDEFSFTKRHLHAKFQKISLNSSQDNMLRTEGRMEGRTHKGESIGPVGLQPGTNNNEN